MIHLLCPVLFTCVIYDILIHTYIYKYTNDASSFDYITVHINDIHHMMISWFYLSPYWCYHWWKMDRLWITICFLFYHFSFFTRKKNSEQWHQPLGKHWKIFRITQPNPNKLPKDPWPHLISTWYKTKKQKLTALIDPNHRTTLWTGRL